MTRDKGRRDVVLVVDDAPESLAMLDDLLSEAGFTALVAVSGAAALSLVKEITPDLILLDAVMPGMDGFETCRALKRESDAAHVPVIFMTGLTETEHIVAGFSAGGVDYVTKPVRREELLARMRTHLGNARIASSARAALDASGRFLLAVDGAGDILWSTPQARRLLEEALGDPVLPAEIRAWLVAARRAAGPATTEIALPGRPECRLSVVRAGEGSETLLRLSMTEAASADALLRQRFALTAREAEVLMWVARGKSSRDVGAILGLSPRTVDKHLEQIYAKLGVENRASAAAVAVTTLNAMS
ncbi:MULTISPECIES: response regulator transcription factor [unclassified Chelatococcus]|uniref:response regulator transcription factor n=1 Tax=unclassified Chelatococcus TaxID=2638111 RepID=UPI00036ECF96|nr:MULTISPECIES: response regulator transcription factor [unclassified Chelatococcus]ALA20177.1 LuxR family transcriptional regulator [Chelatococcus sp. CO-6]